MGPLPLPKLNRVLLWWSLLLPLAVTASALFCGVLFSDTPDQPFGFVGLGIMAGWVLFLVCLNARLRGWSLVLLLLAYPVVQLFVNVALFFAGCVAFTSMAA